MRVERWEGGEKEVEGGSLEGSRDRDSRSLGGRENKEKAAMFGRI